MKCVPNFENNSWKVKNLYIFYNFNLRRVKKNKSKKESNWDLHGTTK